MSFIRAEGLSKWYGQVVGVSDVSFELSPGVIGLLGPNGAGKTTLIKLMAGLLKPSRGRVFVDDQVLRDSPRLYARVGYCPELEALYEFMTGHQFLALQAQLQGMAHPRQAAGEALDRVALTAQSDKLIGAYSRGMRQRLKVAQALLHDPDLLLLDEPLKGADPTQRLLLMELITSLAQRGKTVIVSSHILHEVERMAHQIMVLNHGRLLALGDVQEIRAAMEDRPHRVSLTVSDAKKMAGLLTERSLVVGVQIDGDQLTVDLQNPTAFYAALPDLVISQAMRVTRLASVDDDLESVFHYLVN